MRSVISLGVLGMLVATAHADPFAVRNPTPSEKHDREMPDLGASQRHRGVRIAEAGGVALVSAFAITYAYKQKYDAAVGEGDIHEANHDRRMVRDWGT